MDKIDIGTYIDIYELLRKHEGDNFTGPDFAKAFVISHAERDPPSIVYSERDGKVVGVAFCWQISDPHDVEESNGYPGEVSGGKYCYWPFMYIDSEYRTNGVIGELFLFSAEACPGAKRFAYHRKGDLRIKNIKKMLVRYVPRKEIKDGNIETDRERVPSISGYEQPGLAGHLDAVSGHAELNINQESIGGDQGSGDTISDDKRGPEGSTEVGSSEASGARGQEPVRKPTGQKPF
jgi:hypothetical protein